MNGQIYYTKMHGDRLRPEIMHGDVLAGRQVSAPVFGDLHIIQACGYGEDIVGYAGNPGAALSHPVLIQGVGMCKDVLIQS